VVIRLSYHTFNDDTVRALDFHPYLLKQYNDRWYVLGAADEDQIILNFALDRIDQVEPLPEKKYLPCSEDLSERFEDIVGVSLYKDQKLQHILFWISDFSKGYVETKPIHGSQTPQQGEAEVRLRSQYPQLKSGAFYTIDCIRNYELIRELCSFGKDLLVLNSDGDVKEEVFKRVREMNEEYTELLTSISD
jgi:predicted DNA-binding transcriptional regulator YafY